eukprot:IDg3538t1
MSPAVCLTYREIIQQRKDREKAAKEAENVKQRQCKVHERLRNEKLEQKQEAKKFREEKSAVVKATREEKARQKQADKDKMRGDAVQQQRAECAVDEMRCANKLAFAFFERDGEVRGSRCDENKSCHALKRKPTVAQVHSASKMPLSSFAAVENDEAAALACLSNVAPSVQIRPLFQKLATITDVSNTTAVS